MPNKLQNFNVQSFHMSFEMKIWGFHAYLLIHRCSGGGTVQSPVYGAPYKDFVWYCFFQKFFVKKWQTKHIFFFPFLDYWEHFLWNTTLFKQPSSSLRLCSGGFIKHEIERLWWCFTLKFLTSCRFSQSIICTSGEDREHHALAAVLNHPLELKIHIEGGKLLQRKRKWYTNTNSIMIGILFEVKMENTVVDDNQ